MNNETCRKRRLTVVIDSFNSKPYREYLAIGLFLFLMTVLLHGSALDGYWRWDDGVYLHFVAQYSPVEYFFIPEITKASSGANVTPWNPFFYALNLALFGLNPQGHYSHLLLLVALGCTLFYAVLRLWFPPIAALAGALALLLGKPTIHIAQGLMHGHYATGLVFTLLAILGWVRFLKGGSAAWLCLAALAYLLAATCKEVYVPLPVLLLFLPAGTRQQRLKWLWPFLLIALLYAGWRYAVLGHLLGGYRPDGESFDLHAAFTQMAAIPRLLSATSFAGSLELAVYSSLFFWAAWKNRINWLFLITILIVIALPLVPLTIFPGIRTPDRYLFAFWVMVAGSVAAIWPLKTHPQVVHYLGFVLVGIMGVEHIFEVRRLKPDLTYWDTLYKTTLRSNLNKQHLYIGTDEDGYRNLVLSNAQRALALIEPEKAKALPELISDSVFMVATLPSEKLNRLDLLNYESEKMVPLSSEDLRTLEGRIKNWQEFLTRGSSKEIRVGVRHENGLLHWQFGPYPGNYWVSSSIVTNSIPNEGSHAMRLDRPFDISVCYVNAYERWSTCTPRLRLTPKEKQLFWSGQGEGRLPEPVNYLQSADDR